MNCTGIRFDPHLKMAYGASPNTIDPQPHRLIERPSRRLNGTGSDCGVRNVVATRQAGTGLQPIAQ